MSNAVNVPGVKQPHMFIAKPEVIAKMLAGQRERVARLKADKEAAERAALRAENAKRRAHASDPDVQRCRAERSRRAKKDSAVMRQAKREFDALMAAEVGTKNPRARQKSFQARRKVS